MAFPPPKPGDQISSGDPPPTSRSHAGSPPAGMSPSAVWFTVCAWCERVRIGDHWLEHSYALALAEALNRQPQLTHGICPGCFAALLPRGADAAA